MQALQRHRPWRAPRSALHPRCTLPAAAKAGAGLTGAGAGGCAPVPPGALAQLPGDPSLIIHTNVNMDGIKDEFMTRASAAVAKCLGKPESFVAVCVMVRCQFFPELCLGQIAQLFGNTPDVVVAERSERILVVTMTLAEWR